MSIAVKVTKHGPMKFVGRVTKAGVMNKTVTVVVDREYAHPKTHKVFYSAQTTFSVKC